MTKNVKDNSALSEEYLFELYLAAFKSELVLSAIVQYMKKEFLPDRGFQHLHAEMVKYWKAFKHCPTFGTIGQNLSESADGLDVLDDIKDTEDNRPVEAIIATFEDYIKAAKLKDTYNEIGKLYNQGDVNKALKAISSYAKWSEGFTMSSDNFVDIGSQFKENYEKNKKKVDSKEQSGKPLVSSFYIDGIDALNENRSLRGQATCFLASTGVGKSHIARFIGKQAAFVGGLNVLHIQLEGSRDEVVDAYSSSIVEKDAWHFENARLTSEDFKRALEEIEDAKGSIKVRAFTRFNNQVSTIDVKNSITEYKKTYGKSPDIVIIDSMDLLTDSSGRNYGEDAMRHKMIGVARDLKDIAGDEDLWMITTYQSTIENKKDLDDENFVLTEYNIAEAKGIARPLTHLITLNLTSAERRERQMRLHIAKSRFFKKGDTIKIATDYDKEKFYDRERTMRL